jgi:hypothetical protein
MSFWLASARVCAWPGESCTHHCAGLPTLVLSCRTPRSRELRRNGRSDSFPTSAGESKFSCSEFCSTVSQIVAQPQTWPPRPHRESHRPHRSKIACSDEHSDGLPARALRRLRCFVTQGGHVHASEGVMPFWSTALKPRVRNSGQHSRLPCARWGRWDRAGRKVRDNEGLAAAEGARAVPSDALKKVKGHTIHCGVETLFSAGGGSAAVGSDSFCEGDGAGCLSEASPSSAWRASSPDGPRGSGSRGH